MTIQEFSDQFDVLWNNIASNQAPGLNEYEKSVFLTNAEKQLVREYFNANVDGVGRGFDGSQKRQYDFSKIIKTVSLFNVNTYDERVSDADKIDRRSEVFLLPDDYFLSVNEIISDDKWQFSVMAIDYAEYQRLMLKPYSYPVKRGAWRLITNKVGSNSYKEDGYSFSSTWTENNHSLLINIIVETRTLQEGPEPFIYNGESMGLLVDYRPERSAGRIRYDITLDPTVRRLNLDDAEIIKAIQEFFKQWMERVKDAEERGEEPVNGWSSEYGGLCKATDAFSNVSAPVGKYKMQEVDSRNMPKAFSFQTSYKLLPVVEIIGKFNSTPQYQLRYVRTPNPIILDNLAIYGDDLTIDNQHGPVECELPEEMHEEILERAVTLAKIAWQGGTMTQAAQSNNRE